MVPPIILWASLILAMGWLMLHSEKIYAASAFTPQTARRPPNDLISALYAAGQWLRHGLPKANIPLVMITTGVLWTSESASKAIRKNGCAASRKLVSFLKFPTTSRSP